MAAFDAIVVGAGVIGIAIARSLAVTGRSVLLVDGEPQFGSWTSSRNSEVIHAGIYYPVGSLKTRLCIAGRRLLYAYCETHGIAHRRTGKLIFAHDPGQLGVLDGIAAHARTVGVDDIEALGPAATCRLELALKCAGALLSPSTGIVDSHALMLAMLGEAEDHGALFVANTRVTRIGRADGAWQLHVVGEAGPVADAPVLVNAAGLGAQDVAAGIEGLERTFIPPLFLARGVYFTYSGRTPFSHLIYPVPEPGGLGTHLTLDLAGQARFGPDVEWIDAIDYRVDPLRRATVSAAARRIWPELDAARLQPGYAGIRPKVVGPGEPAADFILSDPSDHGLPGLVNLFGMESPGLTASLAIGDTVRDMLSC